MRGNFTHGRRPSLKKRLESQRRQNAALAARDAANRCPTCRGPLPREGAVTVFGETQRYCRVLCLPAGGSRAEPPR